jgi:glutamyl-Q tRNA(Asp) synthetase
LHAGSLVAALGSWLDARAQGGRWLLRIEDLDTPRNLPGAEAAILASLEAHGLHWDGAVVRQHARLTRYAQALERLSTEGRCYPCACSRREVDDAGGVYPGTCRQGLPVGRTGRAWRLRCPEGAIHWVDRALGPLDEALAQTVGDFVLKRADGIFAYQLAVVVDDAAQGVSDVVRGADLLSSTARQVLLQNWLELPTPRYLHLPLVLGADGRKLSKQNLAAPLDPSTAGGNLLRALAALGQPLPPARRDRSAAVPPAEVLAWALAHWHAPGTP